MCTCLYFTPYQIELETITLEWCNFPFLILYWILLVQLFKSSFTIFLEIFPSNIKDHDIFLWGVQSMFNVEIQCTCIQSRLEIFIWLSIFKQKQYFFFLKIFLNFSHQFSLYILQKEYRMYTIHKIFLQTYKIIYNL